MSDMNLIMKINDYGSLQQQDPKSISLRSNCGVSDSINEQGLSQEILSPGNSATNHHHYICPLRPLWDLKKRPIWWSMCNKAFKGSLLCLFILLTVDLAISILDKAYKQSIIGRFENTAYIKEEICNSINKGEEGLTICSSQILLLTKLIICLAAIISRPKMLACNSTTTLKMVSDNPLSQQGSWGTSIKHEMDSPFIKDKSHFFTSSQQKGCAVLISAHTQTISEDTSPITPAAINPSSGISAIFNRSGASIDIQVQKSDGSCHYLPLMNHGKTVSNQLLSLKKHTTTEDIKDQSRSHLLLVPNAPLQRNRTPIARHDNSSKNLDKKQIDQSAEQSIQNSSQTFLPAANFSKKGLYPSGKYLSNMGPMNDSQIPSGCQQDESLLISGDSAGFGDKQNSHSFLPSDSKRQLPRVNSVFTENKLMMAGESLQYSKNQTLLTGGFGGLNSVGSGNQNLQRVDSSRSMAKKDLSIRTRDYGAGSLNQSLHQGFLRSFQNYGTSRIPGYAKLGTGGGQAQNPALATITSQGPGHGQMSIQFGKTVNPGGNGQKGQNPEVLKRKIRKLEKQLTNTKIFLNMVIHDMRNPTNSIEYAIKEIIKLMNAAFKNANEQSIKRLQSNNSVSQPFHSYIQNAMASSQVVITPTATPGQPNYSSPNTLSQQRLLQKSAQLQQLSGQPLESATPPKQLNNIVQIGQMNPKKTQALHEVTEKLQEDDDELIEDSSSNSNNSQPRLELGQMSNLIMPNLQQSNHKTSESKNSSQLKKSEELKKSSSAQQNSNPKLTTNQDQESQLECPSERSLTSPKKHLVKCSETKLSFNFEISGISLGAFSSKYTVKRRKFLEWNDILVFGDNPSSQNANNLEILGPAIARRRSKSLSRVANDMLNYNQMKKEVESKTPDNATSKNISNVSEAFVSSNPRYQTQPRASRESNNLSKVIARNMNQGGQSEKYVIPNPVEETHEEDKKSVEILVAQPHANSNGYKISKDLTNIVRESIKEKRQNERESKRKESAIDRRFNININFSQLDRSNNNNENQSKSAQKSSRLDRPDFVALNRSDKQSAQQQAASDNSNKNQGSVIQGYSPDLSIPSGTHQMHQQQMTMKFGFQSLEIEKNKLLQGPGLNPQYHQTPYSMQNNPPQRQQQQPFGGNPNSFFGKQQWSPLQRKYTYQPPSQQQMNLGQKIIMGQNSGSFNQNANEQGVLQLNGIHISEEERKQCDQWLRNSLFSSTMLLNLINDLLDLAKIENSQFKFNTCNFNLHEVIQKALDTLDFQASQKSIKMDYVFEEDNAGYFIDIIGDDNRYQQILLNFLSNALKFTPTNGNIKVEIRLLDTQNIQGQKGSKQCSRKGMDSIQGLDSSLIQNESLKKFPRQTRSLERIQPLKQASIQPKVNGEGVGEGEKGKDSITNLLGEDLNMIVENTINQGNKPVEKYIKFEIRIADNGLGISPENISKLFMNFSKLEEHAAGNKCGTGLGLSICKNLIELMGGSVRVESELGKGTTFIMQLQTKCNYPAQKAISSWYNKFKHQKNNKSSFEIAFCHQNIFLGTASYLDVNSPISVPATQQTLLSNNQTMARMIDTNQRFESSMQFQQFQQTQQNPLLNTFKIGPLDQQADTQPFLERHRTLASHISLNQNVVPNFNGSIYGSSNLPTNILQNDGNPLTLSKQRSVNPQFGLTNTSNEQATQFLQVPQSRPRLQRASPRRSQTIGFHQEFGSAVKKQQENRQQEEELKKFETHGVESQDPQSINTFQQDKSLQRFVTNQNMVLKQATSTLFSGASNVILPQQRFNFINNGGVTNNSTQNESEFRANYSTFQQHQMLMIAPSQILPTVHQSARFKALVANDDPFQLSIISSILKNCGFDVDEAENGLVACQKHSELAQKKNCKMYDVIILDLDMPIMNGFEACSRLRMGDRKGDLQQLFQIQKKRTGDASNMVVQDHLEEKSQQSKLFIVALSALITESVMTKGLKCGFDDFIETPINDGKVKGIILARIENHNLYSPRESSEDDTDDIEEEGICENGEFYGYYHHQNSHNFNPPEKPNSITENFTLQPYKDSTENVVKHSHFSAVDEEQSNLQENEDSSNIERKAIVVSCYQSLQNSNLQVLSPAGIEINSDSQGGDSKPITTVYSAKQF